MLAIYVYLATCDSRNPYTSFPNGRLISTHWPDIWVSLQNRFLVMAPAIPDRVFDACGLIKVLGENLIIYRRCQYALSPKHSQVTHHLHHKHRIPLAIRKSLTTYIRQQPVPFKEPASARPRPDGSPVDSQLQLHEGHACRLCLYRTVSRDLIRRHLSQEHLQQQRTSDRRANNLYNDVFLQPWTQSAARKYWIVVYQGQTVREIAPDAAVSSHIASIQQRERARLQVEENAGDVTSMGFQTLESTRPWMERTKWPQTYHGVRRDVLQGLTELPYATAGTVDRLLGQNGSGSSIVSPAADEERLHKLMLAMDCMLDRCKTTLRQTGRSILCWLMTTRPSPYSRRSFGFHGREHSRQDYRRCWKRFLTFAVRAFRMNLEQRQRLTGIRFRKKHLALLTKVWDHQVWNNPQAVTELVSVAQQSRHNAAEVFQMIDRRPGSPPAGTTEEDNDDCGVTDDDDVESSDVESVSIRGGNNKWEAEVCLKHPSSALGMHYGHQLSRTVTASSDVAEFLELCFQLNIALITDSFGHGRPSTSLLVYFSRILGFSPGGRGFQPARNFTPILSRLIYIQRLLFLEYALPAQEYRHLEIPRRPR